MQFLQRSIINENSYVDCGQSEATHFRDVNDGQIKPVGELITNSRIVRLSKNEENLPEPLPMPTLNDFDDKGNDDGEHLPLPKMNFKPKQDKTKKVRNNDVLPLPSMQF